MSNNIDEILKASDNYVNEEPNHSRKDGLKDFAWGTVNIRNGKTDYSADVIVGNNGTRLYLYDVINLKEIKIKERRSNHQRDSPNGKMLNIVASSKSSISQNNKNDNNILNAYAGRKAAEVNLEELENAEKMEKEGKSFEEIFKRTGSSQGILIMIAYVVIIIGFMYFIAIRPQKKQEKKQKALMDSVEIGDSVLTTSGFYGMIIDVQEETVIVEFGGNKNCRIPMQKAAIVDVEKAEA